MQTAYHSSRALGPADGPIGPRSTRHGHHDGGASRVRCCEGGGEVRGTRHDRWAARRHDGDAGRARAGRPAGDPSAAGDPSGTQQAAPQDDDVRWRWRGSARGRRSPGRGISSCRGREPALGRPWAGRESAQTRDRACEAWVPPRGPGPRRGPRGAARGMSPSRLACPVPVAAASRPRPLSRPRLGNGVPVHEPQRQRRIRGGAHARNPGRRPWGDSGRQGRVALTKARVRGRHPGAIEPTANRGPQSVPRRADVSPRRCGSAPAGTARRSTSRGRPCPWSRSPSSRRTPGRPATRRWSRRRAG